VRLTNGTIVFQTIKRTSSTVTIYSYSTGASGKVEERTTANVNVGDLNVSTGGNNQYASNINLSTNGTGGNLVYFMFTADAEL
jgi:hypothetical protein